MKTKVFRIMNKTVQEDRRFGENEFVLRLFAFGPESEDGISPLTPLRSRVLQF